MRAPLALVALLASPTALACGQSTHVWVGIEAVRFLPEGHELRRLLEREDLFAHRVVGAMFPDGGYSPLTQHGYGETAHWEPFQTAYLEWIAETYDPPYDGEAAGHVAFLMGLAAHGMADQIFDGVYLQRSLFHDGAERWATGDVDYATDVAMTAEAGAMPLVDDVVPYDTLVTVFERYGEPTDARTMRLGQNSLFLAVQVVGALGQDEATADDNREKFPWATAHLADPTVICSPACIQPAIAAYWLTLWDRLHDRFDPDAQAIFASWPEDGGWLPVRDATRPEAVVSLALSRAVDTATFGPDSVRVTDAAGVEHPVEARMYYGDDSNVLNVHPLQDWAEDGVYTVTLAPGLTSFDGVALTKPVSITFRIGDPPPADPVGDSPPADPVGDAPATPASNACGGCDQVGGGSMIAMAAALVGVRRRRR